MDEMDEMVSAYIAAARWTNDDIEGELSDDAANSIDTDCGQFRTFAQSFGIWHAETPDQMGHDFWLARNGHGVGFLDRGLGEVGERLTKLSHSFGEQDWEVGDDGLIYVM